MRKRYYCHRCGREFDAVRSDQMYCSKTCRLKNYAETRKAIAKDLRETNPEYVIRMTTTYPKDQKVVVSYFQRITGLRLIEFVGESRIAEAHRFETKREAAETLRTIRSRSGAFQNRLFSIVEIGKNRKEI